MRRLWILIPLLAAGCGKPEPGAPPAEAVASWQGGHLSLAELENAYGEARLPACIEARRKGGGLDELLPCYQALAESLALESLVLAEVSDVDAALAALDDYDRLRRHAYLDLYLRGLPEDVEITSEELEAAFEAQRERFHQPARLTLWDLFRRHEDPERPEATDELLRGLKARAESGEPFTALAREYSQSETRQRDGLVGTVSEGDLPARLAAVAFALGDGEVSEPIRVRGGAVLLQVRNVTEAVDLSLDEARERLRRELTAERVEQAIAEKVAGREPPPDSLVLGLDELTAALDGDDRQAVVLAIGGEVLDAGRLRALDGLAARERAADLDAEGRARLEELYRHQRDRQLLALDLPETADPELRRQAEEHLRAEAIDALVDQRLRDAMDELADADPDQLERYFGDNRQHYQSPLRFQLRTWDLPFGADPPSQLRRMEQLRERLAAGEIDLAEAVDELGGNAEDLGWRDFDSLAGAIPNKAREYLLEIGARGWSVPYQQDNALHLLQLEAREEPRPLEYEEARDRVRDDYLARFRQQLYRRVLEARLADARFAFDADAVRRLLADRAAPDQRPPR